MNLVAKAFARAVALITEEGHDALTALDCVDAKYQLSREEYAAVVAKLRKAGYVSGADCGGI